MSRLTMTLAAVLASAALAMPAMAQGRNCVALNILSIDSTRFGTERIPRDPRNPASTEQLTASATIRNLTGASVGFTASFSASGVQSEFVSGQHWTLAPGASTGVTLGNVLRGSANDAFVRRALRLYCP